MSSAFIIKCELKGESKLKRITNYELLLIELNWRSFKQHNVAT